MEKIIYNTSEYYEKTDEYYALIAKKLLLERKIYLLGKQLDIPKENSDQVCKHCSAVTNKFYDLENEEKTREEFKNGLLELKKKGDFHMVALDWFSEDINGYKKWLNSNASQ